MLKWRAVYPGARLRMMACCLGFLALIWIVSLMSQGPDSLSAAAAVRQVNVPYTKVLRPGVPVPERAIFWFGEVGPTTSNYADVRLIYNAEELIVAVHVFDRHVWYDTTPSAGELTDWDTVSLYLNLDGNVGTAPGAATYRLVSQYHPNFATPADAYSAAYRGTGVGWQPYSGDFETSPGLQGVWNDTEEDRGWNMSFYIPYESLELSGKPDQGTTWGLAVAVHDRDDAAGSPITPQMWPDGVDVDVPQTWGRLRFGLKNYAPAPAVASDTVTIRHGLNGITVEDGQVGGDSVCASEVNPNFWEGWGSLNYSDGSPSRRFVVQNQWNLGDWPCFSKYYVTVPLDSLPDGKVVISAELTLYQFGNSNQGGGYDPTRLPEPTLLQVMTIDEVWDEATLTWNNAPLALENVGRAWVDPLPLNPSPPNVARTVDISGAVAQAYAEGMPLQLALYSADNALHSGKYFRSSDAGDPEVRPTLVVVLGDPLDLGSLEEKAFLPLTSVD